MIRVFLRWKMSLSGDEELNLIEEKKSKSGHVFIKLSTMDHFRFFLNSEAFASEFQEKNKYVFEVKSESF